MNQSPLSRRRRLRLRSARVVLDFILGPTRRDRGSSVNGDFHEVLHAVWLVLGAGSGVRLHGGGHRSRRRGRSFGGVGERGLDEGRDEAGGGSDESVTRF